MRKKRRNSHSYVIDRWESYGDPQLTQILKELEKIADDLSGNNKVHRFVTKVVAWNAAPELKLKLIRHIFDRDMLDKISLKSPDKPKEYERLERAYRTLFKEWWNGEEQRFRSLPVEARIQALTEYRSQLPEKLDFPRILKQDFDLTVSALIQASEREKDLLPNPALGNGLADESHSQIDSTVSPIPWTGPKNELVELFNILIRLKKIPAVRNAEKYRYIEEHFVDRNNEPFKAKNLGELERITHDTHTGRPKGIHALEGEIIMMMKSEEVADLED